MYTCLCRGITETQIQEAVEQGARCNRDLNRLMGAEPVCGECGPYTREVIRNCCATASPQDAMAS